MQEKHGRGEFEALKMLDLFASVGTDHFDVTFTNILEEKLEFLPNRTVPSMRYNLPAWVKRSAVPRPIQITDDTRRETILAGENLIVRPRQPAAVLLIQLDDLDTASIERVRPAAFMIVNTSPGNHQAWVAVAGEIADRKDFARRVRKGAGADLSASGATRVAGTANFKHKYAPDFPTVRITAAEPGRTVTAAMLEALGLVAAPEPVRTAPPRLETRRAGAGKRWPSYEVTLRNAPKAHNADKPDISRVDFTWCMTAIDWGFSIEATAARLMQESSKARENGERYADITARNAAAAVDRERGRGNHAAMEP